MRFSDESVDADTLKAKITSAQQPVGEPDLQKALEEAEKLFESDPNRGDVKRVLVVITDKRSSSTPESVKNVLVPLEDRDVKIVPVAVGASADPNELERITSNRGYLIKKERELDPDTTAEEIIEKVLKGMEIFSDKDDKPWASSHNPSMFITLWDVKEPTHYSQRVRHGVPRVMVCSL